MENNDNLMSYSLMQMDQEIALSHFALFNPFSVRYVFNPSASKLQHLKVSKKENALSKCLQNKSGVIFLRDHFMHVFPNMKSKFCLPVCLIWSPSNSGNICST